MIGLIKENFNLDSYSNDSPIGCFLDVDFDYLDESHDLHNDYLLVGEKINATEEIQSRYQLHMIEDNFLFLVKTKRLIPNLDNKRKETRQY